MASGSDDKMVRVREAESGRLVQTLAGHTSGVYALSGLPGGVVTSGSQERTAVAVCASLTLTAANKHCLKQCYPSPGFSVAFDAR